MSEIKCINCDNYGRCIEGSELVRWCVCSGEMEKECLSNKFKHFEPDIEFLKEEIERLKETNALIVGSWQDAEKERDEFENDCVESDKEIEKLKAQLNDDDSLDPEDWNRLMDSIKNPKFNEKLAKFMSEPCPFDVEKDDKDKEIDNLKEQLDVAVDLIKRIESSITYIPWLQQISQTLTKIQDLQDISEADARKDEPTVTVEELEKE